MKAEIALAPARPRLEMKNFTKDGQRIIGLFGKFKSRCNREDSAMPLVELYETLGEFNRRYGTRLSLASPATAEAILHDGSAGWRFVMDCAPFPVDAMVGFERKGVPLGKEIVFAEERGQRMVMPTHKYQGARNLGLLVKRPTAAELGRRSSRETFLKVGEERLVPVENIHGRTGWRENDEETGLPIGRAVDPAMAEAREMKIVTDSACICAPVMDTGFREHRRTVCLGYSLSLRLGAVVEVPSYDVERLGGRVGQGVDPRFHNTANVRYLVGRDSPESDGLPEPRTRNSLLEEIRAHLPQGLKGALEEMLASMVRTDRNNTLKVIRACLPKRIRPTFDKVISERLEGL